MEVSETETESETGEITCNRDDDDPESGTGGGKEPRGKSVCFNWRFLKRLLGNHHPKKEKAYIM